MGHVDTGSNVMEADMGCKKGVTAFGDLAKPLEVAGKHLQEAQDLYKKFDGRSFFSRLLFQLWLLVLCSTVFYVQFLPSEQDFILKVMFVFVLSDE
ncbi:unnamed protein product [Lactuca virosa]|uniref:Uncharacterized protein n=1 Tax=Lactuca virosa TaxID=75947 RepID=A0AAU9MUR9_9ASTR|nr:unnamed protein product [Lactuca virosa]